MNAPEVKPLPQQRMLKLTFKVLPFSCQLLNVNFKIPVHRIRFSKSAILIMCQHQTRTFNSCVQLLSTISCTDTGTETFDQLQLYKGNAKSLQNTFSHGKLANNLNYFIFFKLNRKSLDIEVRLKLNYFSNGTKLRKWRQEFYTSATHSLRC